MQSTNPLALLCAASLLLVVTACAGKDDATTDSTKTGATSAPTTSAAEGQASTTAASGLLDPNTATRDQIMALPGMDATAADAIVAGRPHENMLSVEKILAPKLSEAQRDTVYGRMFKPLDLNTATKEEIMLIPGVGERMNREFAEYRPYQNIEKFRREMAKYVGDTTIARYERYVTIR